MAKVGIFSTIIANLKFKNTMATIKRKVGRKEFMMEIGKQIKELIQGDTRSGKGVADPEREGGGIEIRLAALSDTYVRWRRKQVNRAFTPGKFFRQSRNSNLTLTGQMLEAIDFTARQGFVKVYVKNTSRSGYGKEYTNKEISDFHHERGSRPFMGLTQKNKRIIDREIERETRAIIRRELAR